jgi:COP9 signalosome complex subunit 5
LEISYFKSSLDSFLLDKLWSKYWKNTLASSPLISSYVHSTKQIADLAEKLKRSASATSYGKSDTEKLKKLSHDAGKVTHELCCAWMHETMKNVLFTPMTKDNADATLIETIVTLESMTES